MSEKKSKSTVPKSTVPKSTVPKSTVPKSTVPKSTVSAPSSIATLSGAIPPRRRMAQNYLVIWVDGNIDENNNDCRNTLTQLRAVVSDVNVCTTPEQCVEFINEIDDGKAFIISSGALGQSLVNDIHSLPKVDAIYIFCDNKTRYESWAKEWPKIRGVFTLIKPICESLKKVAHECDHDSIPMSFVPKQTMAGGATGSGPKNLDRLPPTYMYSVIFKDIILEIDDDDEKSMNTLAIYCQKQNIPEKEINKFKLNYHQKSAVWWYTKQIFLYGMLNRGLRSLDMEAMFKLGFFIRKLHLQLEQLHQEQSASFKKYFTVYRGQGLSQQDFQNLMDSKGGKNAHEHAPNPELIEVQQTREKIKRRVMNELTPIGMIYDEEMSKTSMSTTAVAIFPTVHEL
ncbi:unnamed protein product, partial [Rotaria socialis]